MLEIICVWGISKSGVALRILGVAPEVGEKGVVLRVGEKSASGMDIVSEEDTWI